MRRKSRRVKGWTGLLWVCHAGWDAAFPSQGAHIPTQSTSLEFFTIIQSTMTLAR